MVLEDTCDTTKKSYAIDMRKMNEQHVDEMRSNDGAAEHCALPLTWTWDMADAGGQVIASSDLLAADLSEYEDMNDETKKRDLLKKEMSGV